LLHKYHRPGFKRGGPNESNVLKAILGSCVEEELGEISQEYGIKFIPSIFEAYIF